MGENPLMDLVGSACLMQGLRDCAHWLLLLVSHCELEFGFLLLEINGRTA